MAVVRFAALGVLLLATTATAAPTAEEAVRAYLKLEDEKLYDVAEDVTRAWSHPALLAVIGHGDRAIPLLIGALRNEGAWHGIPRRVDLALLAITTGLPPERIRPRGSRHRLTASGNREAWFKWWREGRPVRSTSLGVLVPTSVNVTAIGLRPAKAPEPEPALTALIQEERIAPAEVLEALARLGSTERHAAYQVMRVNPDRWLPVLLERLDAPRVDFASLVRERLAAGAMRSETARPVLDRLDASPHAFVRQRAAEALFGLAPKDGKRRLRRELTIWFSGQRPIGKTRFGRWGYAGRVDRILDPPTPTPAPAPPERADLGAPEGEPVTLPAGSFEFRVHRIPYAEKARWSISVEWAGEGTFTRYPDYRYSLDPRDRQGEAPPSEWGIHWHHNLICSSAAPLHVARGEMVCDAGVSVPFQDLHRLGDVGITFTFALPGRREGRLAIEVPAERFDRRPDLDVARALLFPESGPRETGFLHRFEPQRGARTRPMRTGERIRFKSLLLDALVDEDRLSDSGLDPRVFFGRLRVDQTRAARRLASSLETFADDLAPGDVERLLRLENPATVNQIAHWRAHSVRNTAIGVGSESDDPRVIRNLALLYTRPPYEQRTRLRKAASRWLESEDELVLTAGLFLGKNLPADRAPENLGKGVDSALGSASRTVRRAGALSASRRFDQCGDRIRLHYLAGDELTRKLLIECLCECASALRPSPELRAILEIELQRGDQVHPGVQGLCWRDLADTPLLLSAWNDTQATWIRNILGSRGHHFGLPLVQRIQATPPLGTLAREWGRDLVAGELARLDAKTPEAPHLHYATRLREGLRTGRGSGAACLPLAVAEDDASIALLEIACRALDEGVRRAAAWCLHVRSPIRARPYLRDLMEDRQRTGRPADPVGMLLPEAKDERPLLPLPPVFELK